MSPVLGWCVCVCALKRTLVGSQRRRRRRRRRPTSVVGKFGTTPRQRTHTCCLPHPTFSCYSSSSSSISSFKKLPASLQLTARYRYECIVFCTEYGPTTDQQWTAVERRLAVSVALASWSVGLSRVQRSRLRWRQQRPACLLHLLKLN